jgi:hypothetical protein
MMTDDQHRDAAKKLVEAVKNNTNGAYDKWTAPDTDLSTVDARAEFVKSAAGLDQKPTAEDLAGIQHHVSTSLQADVAEIRAKNPGQHTVGMICAADD